MNTQRSRIAWIVFLIPFCAFTKVKRAPLSETPDKGVKVIESTINEADIQRAKTIEESPFQKNFFAAVSYSLFSPTFETVSLRSQNQESLGLSALFGYSYVSYQGWGAQGSLGLLQHSKTDRSLPDLILIKPAASVVYALAQSLYFTGGLFNYFQHGQNLKNFKSHIGQEYFVGYKANKKINIKFGFSYAKFSGDFASTSGRTNSLVSVRALESQLVYLF